MLTKTRPKITLTIKVKPFAYIVLFQVIILLVVVVLLLLAAIGGGVAVFLTTSFKDEELQESGNFFPLLSISRQRIHHLSVDCSVGPWGAWTSCYLPPGTCGIGKQNRTRWGVVTEDQPQNIENLFLLKGRRLRMRKTMASNVQNSGSLNSLKAEAQKVGIFRLADISAQKLYRQIESELNN